MSWLGLGLGLVAGSVAQAQWEAQVEGSVGGSWLSMWLGWWQGWLGEVRRVKGLGHLHVVGVGPADQAVNAQVTQPFIDLQLQHVLVVLFQSTLLHGTPLLLLHRVSVLEPLPASGVAQPVHAHVYPIATITCERF